MGDTAEIIRRISDAQAVFTNKTPLTEEAFEARAIRYMRVCWLPGTMWWIMSQHQPRESLYAIFLHIGTAAAAQYTIVPSF